jgi:hypothetical protein
MYLDPCSTYVREHVEQLREEAAHDRLAARVEHGPGMWETVRSILAARLPHDDAIADDDAR